MAAERPYRKWVVHIHDAPYDVYIGRGSESVWGNPYTHFPAERAKAAKFFVKTRKAAIDCYRSWILSRPDLIERAKRELRGKILGCYCAPRQCHGEVLAEIANAE